MAHTPWGRAGIAAIVAAAAGCDSPAPTRPLPPTPVALAPTPQPTPSPEESDPPSARQPDIDPKACASPSPPPLARMDVGILIVGQSRLILDSTPIVGPDPDFCEAIGYTDRRRFCPPRPEGHPERTFCDALLVGRAADTGRYGPTWTANLKPCVVGAIRPPFCGNHPENQFLVFAYGRGLYEACSQSGVCGAVRVP